MGTLLDGSGGASAVAQAQAALDGVHDDPKRTLRTATALLQAGSDPRAQVLALWAVGFAHRELNEIDAACDSLRAAAVLAEGTRDPEAAAKIRISLAAALFTRGDKDGAFGELDVALGQLTGTDHARAVMQRGLLEFQLGDLTRAVASLDAALPALRAGGDRLAEARLRLNRAAALTTLGRLGAAEADLLHGQRLAGELGQKLLAAGAQHNLGFLAGRRGDVPRALQWYDLARASYGELADLRRLVAVLDQDRCEVLLAAGLAIEAMETAARAVEAHARDGNQVDLAEAELLLAHAQLVSGRFADAGAVAQRSRDRFDRLDRRAWSALAAYLGIQARVLDPARADHVGPDLLGQTVALTEELEALGWRDEALHVRTFAARIALQLGEVGAARHHLELAARARQRGPAAERVQAWFATALLRHLEGNEAGARRALDAGLRLVDEARAGMGSSELRATVAHHGADLVDLGLQLALLRGRPRAVLTWVERCRALALLAPPARPPDDEAFASALADLRQARREVRDAIAAGQPGGDADRRVARIERSVRERARQATGGALHRTPAIVGDDISALSDQVLVQYLCSAGHLLALVARDGRVRQHDLGPVGGLHDDLESLGFALHRLARQQGSERSRSLAARTLDELGARAGARLLEPLARSLGDRPAVIVPDPSLHRVPWAALPQLWERPFSVSPSLRAHAQARQVAGRAGRDGVGARPLLVAGPGLPGAEDEVAQLRAVHPDATVLLGGAATVEAVCEALGACRLAHLACHGRVRVDNPLFSSLSMADGDLTVYDLERCSGVPLTIVLSACYSGVGMTVAGTEILGLSTAFLSLGCATVIAPLAPVSDAAMAPVMVALHGALRQGVPPSAALAGAGAGSRRTEARAGWMALAAFGAG